MVTRVRPPVRGATVFHSDINGTLKKELVNRKVSKNRGHFPNDTAAVKLLWLAICNIEDKRALERERDRGKPAGKRRAKPRLVEGQTTTNWKQALAQLTTAYPDRINPYL